MRKPVPMRTQLVLLGVTAAAVPWLAHASARYSDWQVPVLNVGGVVNTAAIEAAPAISRDGLSLYFMSTRPGGLGGFDLWVTERATADAPWGTPFNLGPLINTPGNEDRPALSRDGHWLFFNTDRPGGLGGIDLWASWRPHVHDNLAWQAPVNLGPGVNSAFNDSGASYFPDDDHGVPKLFFASDRPGGPGAADIYVAELLADGTFAEATLVPELSTLEADLGPSIRHDGLEVVLFSGPFRAEDLRTSGRSSVFDPWNPPAAIPGINTAAREIQPYLSADRQELYFASNRTGGFGAADIYVTTRIRSRSAQ